MESRPTSSTKIFSADLKRPLSQMSRSSRGFSSYSSAYFPLKNSRTPAVTVRMPQVSLRGGGDSILVVDDISTNRFVLRAALQHAGYSVSEADSGERCLEICETNPPAVVLLDCVMPGIDGIETCRRLREKFGRAHLPVLMVTSLSESENLVQAIAAGASDYVTKPIDKTVLLARVASQLELRRSHRELEQALEVQRTIGEMLPQAFVVQRGDDEILSANGKVPRSLRSQGVTQMFAQLANGIAADEFSAVKKRLANDPLAEVDFEVSRETGSVRALEVTSRAVATVGGDTLRLWLWRDLTANRELERKVNERVRLDMVSLFVGGVAHNFNNMLMSVAGAAEMLERNLPDDPKAKRLLKIIRDGTASAVKFTRKMNVFTRPELDQGQRTGQSVEELVDAVVLGLEAEFGERVTFEVNSPHQLPQTNLSLPHLSEVLANLVRNAAESIPDRGRVSVSLSHTQGSEHLVAVITDDGVGMGVDILGRVFEPFFSTKNLDERNSVSMRGNGLGLWNVYNLVKLSGGDITIESAKGHGTVVTVLLPVKAES
jgi:signal transduction histidine kinase